MTQKIKAELAPNTPAAELASQLADGSATVAEIGTHLNAHPEHYSAADVAALIAGGKTKPADAAGLYQALIDGKERMAQSRGAAGASAVRVKISDSEASKGKLSFSGPTLSQEPIVPYLLRTLALSEAIQVIDAAIGNATGYTTETVKPVDKEGKPRIGRDGKPVEFTRYLRGRACLGFSGDHADRFDALLASAKELVGK